MKKVLIVDDDRLITRIYERHFRADGFDVRIANTGQGGLHTLHAFVPDAVLLDLNMPDVNGIDWLRQVRGDARFARLPVLVLTAGAIGWQLWAASHSNVAFVFKNNAVPRDVVQSINDAIAAARITRRDEALRPGPSPHPAPRH